MTQLFFASDNAAGASPQIMAALGRANEGVALAYGNDAWTRRVEHRYSEWFERQAFVFPAFTGTAANALALSTITPPYGEVLCHASSHIFTTECGAAEFYAGGARLVPLPGDDGMLSSDTLAQAIADRPPGNKHHLALSALSITQATEAGTVYPLAALAALCDSAHRHGMKVHMDGARFANALVRLGASPADMSWRCGIDVLSMGTTKNGTMNAEVVVVFDQDIANELVFRQKRAGLLLSKMRYASAQLAAYLDDDLWRHNAQRANDAATRLGAVLQAAAGVELVHPIQTNQLFVHLAPPVLAALGAAGITFRRWGTQAPAVYRLVTSFETSAADIEQVARAVAPLATGATVG